MIRTFRLLNGPQSASRLMSSSSILSSSSSSTASVSASAPASALAAAAASAAPSKAQTKSKQRYPLFLAFCPDSKAPDTLPTRLKVRAKHFERVEEDKVAGILEFGRGFLPPPSSALHSHPSLAPGHQSMAGSIMFFRLPSLTQAWERVKEDVYWTEGVWDKQAVRVEQFLNLGDWEEGSTESGVSSQKTEEKGKGKE